jgi:uncharacterized membrane protein YphA (DoxX/SURF4 family)
MKRKIAIEAISIILVILFVYAALSKILDFETFRVQLGKSPLLALMAGLIAYVVPTAELLISLLLVFSRTRLIGLYSSLMLLFLFTAYLIAILNFSYYVPCSCGGILQGMSWRTHIFFNLGFIVLSIIGIVLQYALRNEVNNNNIIQYV